MKSLKILLVMVLVSVFLTGFVVAEDYFSANDLEPAAIKSVTKIDEVFSIYATSEKGVTIEALTGENAERTASDGEVFNNRIKLNGSGKIEQRSVHFITKGKAKVTVYTNSSSKTDARVLAVVNIKDGSVIAELTAPADGTEAGVVSCTVPTAGEYAIFSKGSGINLYQIVVE